METTNPFDSYLAKHEGVLDNQPSLDDEALLDAYVEKKQKKNDEDVINRRPYYRSICKRNWFNQ